jgi:hypothetical protein
MAPGGLAQQLAQSELRLRPLAYELDLRVDFEAETLRGSARLTVVNASPRPADELTLLLYRLLRVTAVADVAGEPLTFEQQVLPLDDWPEMHVNLVVAPLSRPLAPGDSTAFAIRWEGRLEGYQETGMRYVQDRIDPDFTIIRPDARAYPEIGLPSLAVIRGVGLPAFTYRASVTVPESHTVASVGQLVERTVRDGLATFVYISRKPSWRMDFAIARYDVLEDGADRVFFFPRHAAGARRVLAAVDDSRRLYTEWFGPLRDSTGFTVIEIPDGWGSQKDVTGIIQAAAAFRDAARAREVYHEVAHFWTLSVNDQPSPRWDEGLASYLEYRVTDYLRAEGVPERLPAVAAQVATALEGIRQSFQEHPERREIPLSEYGRHQLTDLSYRVGLVLFAVLEQVVGPQQFNRIVGEYYRRFAPAGATTDEFVVLARSVSDQDLGPFFHDWMYTTGWYGHVRDGATLQDLVMLYREAEPETEQAPAP